MRFLPFSLVLSLAACDEPIVIDPPAPAPEEAPALGAGWYELRIDGVNSMECRGARPREIIGQSVYAELRLAGAEASLRFEGWRLDGDMRAGNLYVEGGYEEPAVIILEDEPGEGGEVEPDDGSGSSDGSTGTADEAPDVDCGDDRADCGEEEEPPEEAAFASLDAQIRESDQADGRLTLSMPGCSMELAVAMTRSGPPDEPVYSEGGGEADADSAP